MPHTGGKGEGGLLVAVGMIASYDISLFGEKGGGLLDASADDPDVRPIKVLWDNFLSAQIEEQTKKH